MKMTCWTASVTQHTHKINLEVVAKLKRWGSACSLTLGLTLTSINTVSWAFPSYLCLHLKPDTTMFAKV